MTELTICLVLIIFVSLVIYLFKWIKNRPVTPDPWDKYIDKDELESSEDAVCLNCTTPVKNFQQHYCPKCGNITGEYTRYIPFVNIQFNYTIFGTLWHKLADVKISWLIKSAYFLLIIFFAPIMFPVWILGFCFIKIKNIIKQSSLKF
jgi:hypothetical protein